MQYHQSESHHKELAACTDEQLCAMAAAGDREAEELLVTRYYGTVSYTHLTLPTTERV